MSNTAKWKIIYLLIGLLSLVSCKDEKESNGWGKDVESIDDMFDVFKKEIKLKAEVFINDTVHLLRPFRFKMFKNYMIINDKDDNTIYSVYDMQKKTFIGRFIGKGRGANEYLAPYLNNFGEDTIMILDNIRQRIALFSIKKIINCDNTPDRVIQLTMKNQGDAINKSFFFNNLLLSTGQFKQGRFYIHNISGHIQIFFGSYPKVTSKVKYDNYHLGYIYGGNEEIRSNSQSSKFACIHGTSLTIFNYNNKQDMYNQTFDVQWHIEKIKEATYKDGKPYVMRIGNGAEIGAGHLAANDKYLFFPFSKHEYIDVAKGDIIDYYGYIFVADWDGNPVARLKLDRRIKFPLEIDKEGNFLYSIHTDTETGFSKIIRFDISFLKDI